MGRPCAGKLIERVIDGEWLLAFSPLTLANIFYIYRRQSGTRDALAALDTIRRMGVIATLDAGHVHMALGSQRPDFEDELQIACAESLPGLAAIITRNLSDYTHSHVPAITASDWLARHPAKQSAP